MTSRPMTRRSLLAVTAGAMASGLVRPGGALAAALAGPRRPTVGERWIGRLAPGGVTVTLASSVDLLGVQWQAPVGAAVELRFQGDGARWSAWVSAGAHGHGPEGHDQTGATVGDPVWTGGTRRVQLRASRALSGVRLHLVDVSGGLGARRLARTLGPLAATATLPQATPVLAAGAGQPPIIARRGWAQGISPPRVAPEYGSVRMGFVHHTENPNGYAAGEVPAMLRAIYAFHRYVKGWNDIGYNFVVDAYGRIFEARAGGIDEPVVGAHAGGYNLVSSGVAVLGSFMSAPISPAARTALERLLAWKLSLHGLPAEGNVTVRVNPAGASYSRFPANARVSLPRIAGHRDGDSTDCPGDVLYRELPGIRASVRRLAPRPVRATLALAPAATPAPVPTPAPPGGEPPVAVPTLGGAVQFLDGTPIAGAAVEVQARTVSRRGEVVLEQTLATLTTDPQGQFSLPASLPAGRLWLRALCPGSSAHGAAVSDPLRVTVSAAVIPPPGPAPTPPVAAPPAQ